MSNLSPEARKALEAALRQFAPGDDMLPADGYDEAIFDAGRAHQRIVDAAICRAGKGRVFGQAADPYNAACECNAKAIEAQP